MSDLGNVIEILQYAKVKHVTVENVREIMDDNKDVELNYSQIVKKYIEKFNPELYQKLYIESKQELADYSQYHNFFELADQKRMIILGFLRNHFDLDNWPLDLNTLISMYYTYFLLCDVRSSNYNYMSPSGEIMESYCQIDGEHLEINNKPQNEGVEGRGMHFIALDAVHGNALTVHNFDTWSSEEDGKQFQRVCSNVRANTVVVLFAKDSAEWYSPRGLNVLHTKHGIATQSIAFRQTFICVFQTKQDVEENVVVHFEFVGAARENPSIAYRAAIKLLQCSE